MFDTLMDDFDHVAASSEDVVTGGFRKLPVDDSEDDNAAAVAAVASGSVQLESPDELIAVDESEPWSDDPVRMYLREMGSVELLSRQGEIAIAKRIEAGRNTMIAGLCESPLTFQAITI